MRYINSVCFFMITIAAQRKKKIERQGIIHEPMFGMARYSLEAHLSPSTIPNFANERVRPAETY